MRFVDAIAAAGLRPLAVIADGEWHRCPTESHPRSGNGAYKLHPGGAFGWYQDWAAHEAPIAWRADDSARAVAAVRPAESAQAKAQRIAARKQAMAAARRHYGGSRRIAGHQHPYLASKSLGTGGCQALREDAAGALVVPAMRREWMVSVQRIWPDGQKRYWPGAPMKGAYFIIDRPGSTVTAIAEGVATGLAVFQAVRFSRVIVAFDAGNLLPVVDLLRPSGSVVVCADNDHETMERRGFNPGLEKAINAASLIDAGVAWPEGIHGTDWADARVEWGKESDRRIERLILAKARYSSVPRT